MISRVLLYHGQVGVCVCERELCLDLCPFHTFNRLWPHSKWSDHRATCGLLFIIIFFFTLSFIYNYYWFSLCDFLDSFLSLLWLHVVHRTRLAWNASWHAIWFSRLDHFVFFAEPEKNHLNKSISIALVYLAHHWENPGLILILILIIIPFEYLSFWPVCF